MVGNVEGGVVGVARVVDVLGVDAVTGLGLVGLADLVGVDDFVRFRVMNGSVSGFL